MNHRHPKAEVIAGGARGGEVARNRAMTHGTPGRWKLTVFRLADDGPILAKMVLVRTVIHDDDLHKIARLRTTDASATRSNDGRLRDGMMTENRVMEQQPARPRKTHRPVSDSKFSLDIMLLANSDHAVYARFEFAAARYPYDANFRSDTVGLMDMGVGKELIRVSYAANLNSSGW
jgi:hypothetical protein